MIDHRSLKLLISISILVPCLSIADNLDKYYLDENPPYTTNLPSQQTNNLLSNDSVKDSADEKGFHLDQNTIAEIYNDDTVTSIRKAVFATNVSTHINKDTTIGVDSDRGFVIGKDF